ncbi:MAG TPA: hypothetical protein VGB25_11235 [Candidatus Binatia bacterium]
MSGWDTLLGFLLAFLLFLLTQLGRERKQRRALRRALLLQLRALEAALSATVIRSSYGLDDPTPGVRELRWYLAEGRPRIDPSPLPKSMAELKDRSDEEIASYLKGRRREPDRLFQAPPIQGYALQSILTIHGSGFSTKELDLLADLSYQIAYLQAQRDQIAYCHQLTSGLIEEGNHGRIRERIARLEKRYYERLESILRHFRSTLAKLEEKPVGLKRYLRAPRTTV